MIKDIIRLKAQALSHEQIAIALKVSKGVVSKYLTLASAVGLDWETAQALNEIQLTARLLPRTNTLGGFVEPDWANMAICVDPPKNQSRCKRLISNRESPLFGL